MLARVHAGLFRRTGLQSYGLIAGPDASVHLIKGADHFTILQRLLSDGSER